MELADLLATFLAVVISTFLPLYLGIITPRVLNPRSLRAVVFLSAAAVGMLFWFFLDWMGGSARLGVDGGFEFTHTRVLLVASFPIGLATMFWSEGVLEDRFPSSSGQGPSLPAVRGLTFVAVALVAVGISFHAMGEGNSIGALLSAAPDFLEAIGGVGGGVSYVLHKFLEGFVLGAFALSAGPTVKRLGVLGGIVGIPTALGFFLGMLATVESTYFFALAGASFIYACLKVVPGVATTDSKHWIALAMLLGFFAVYFASLFHVGT